MRIFLYIFLIAFCSCSTEFSRKDFPSKLSLSAVNDSTNLVTGKIELLGREIVDHGHCWSLENPPTHLDSTTSFGATSETISFSSTINPIRLLERHFYAAYLVDELGDVYYSEVFYYRPE